MTPPNRQKPMSSLDLDLDDPMSNLEFERRRGYEAGMFARADHQALAADPKVNADGDAASTLLERRWFASIAATHAMQAECEVLREVVALAEESWRRACTQLARLEALRDALGEELADAEGRRCPENAAVQVEREVSSAA